jgi:DNA-binding beta-propeller fold protein YncE
MNGSRNDGTTAPSMTSHPRFRGRLVAAAAVSLVVALSISCDDGPTEPGVLAHPAGTPSGRLTIAGSPSGIAVSSRGSAWVTMLDGNEIARFAAAASPALKSSIALAVPPMHVVFNRIGSIALVAAFDLDRWVVYSVDVASGDATFAREMLGPPYRIALSRDEKRLYYLTYGDPARVYSVPMAGLLDDTQSYILQIPGLPRAIAVSPTTGEVIVATKFRVARLDPVTVEIKAMAGPVPVGPEDLAIAPDGSRVWYGNTAGNLVALDASSLAQVAEVAHGAPINGLALSPDGAQLWATSLGDLVIVDAASGSIVNRLTLGGTAAHIGFDPAGTTAFVTNQAGWVDVIR